MCCVRFWPRPAGMKLTLTPRCTAWCLRSARRPRALGRSTSATDPAAVAVTVPVAYVSDVVADARRSRWPEQRDQLKRAGAVCLLDEADAAVVADAVAERHE